MRKGIWWLLAITGYPNSQEKGLGFQAWWRGTKGVGSLQGLCRRSGFSFADSAFWAAVTICSLQRRRQKNVPCLEMKNSPSHAGDRGWLLRVGTSWGCPCPEPAARVSHDYPHWHELVWVCNMFLSGADSSHSPQETGTWGMVDSLCFNGKTESKKQLELVGSMQVGSGHPI